VSYLFIVSALPCLPLSVSARLAGCLFGGGFLCLELVCLLSQGLPVFVFRAVSVGVGFLVPVAPSGPVCPSQSFEQMSDLARSNKFSKHLFEWLFGLFYQNFQPNLTEFQPNPSFELNRILTESRNPCR
jgi:hypothetical protein